MLRRDTRLLVGFVAASTIAFMSLFVQSVTGSACGTGILYATFNETTIVTIDPVTAARTTIVDLTVPGSWYEALINLESDASGQRLFTQRVLQSSQSGPTTYQLVTVDTQTHVSNLTATLEEPLILAWDPSTLTLFGATSNAPHRIVKVDPTTGAETPFASLPGPDVSSIAMAPAQHMMYLAVANPVAESLVAVDTVTGDVTVGPVIDQFVMNLVYDETAGALFARAPCCPARLLQIDLNTGSGTVLASLGAGGGNTLTLDPITQTLYSMAGDGSGNQFVASISAGGTLSLSSPIPLSSGFLRNLAFVAP